MIDIIKNIFAPTQYMPHGHCYLWQTPLVWLHIISDFLIGIAYFSIPTMLVYFVYKRSDLPFSKVFLMFGAFIISCGTGHFIDIWTLWYPAYWLSGIEKAFTAFISCYTALELVTLLPQFLSLQTPEKLEVVNQELTKEIAERKKAEAILQSIIKGTASVTGEQFFAALAENLAHALQVSNVFINEALKEHTFKILAFYENNQVKTNIIVDSNHTPCEAVFQQKEILSYPEKLQELFPNANLLKDIHAESYLGIPLVDHEQNVLGTLSIVHNQPLDNIENTLAIMKVFAARAGAELQRQKVEVALLEAYNKLEIRVAERTQELEKEIKERKTAELALFKSSVRLTKQQAGLLELAKNYNFSEGKLDECLPEILELATNIFNVSRASVWLYNHDKSHIYCFDLYDTHLNKHQQRKQLNIQDYPTYFKVIASERLIASQNVYEDERLKEFSQDYFPTYNIKSMLDIPINFKREIIGVICLEETKKNRIWSIEEQNFGSYLAYMISLAMESCDRRLAQEALLQKNQELASTLEELKSTQKELIQSEKMAALGQLIAGVAHEINTPLGVITSSIRNINNFWSNHLAKLPSFFQNLEPEIEPYVFKLLQKNSNNTLTLSTREERKIKRKIIAQLENLSLSNPHKIANYLIALNISPAELSKLSPLLNHQHHEEILGMAYEFAKVQTSSKNITTASEKAAKVVFALKNYAHYDFSGKKIFTDIIENIETVLTLYYNTLKQGIKIIRKYSPNLPQLLCYPDELNQVWVNLIQNALQAMKNKGILTIEILEKNNAIQINIINTGEPIPEEIQSKIFQPFFTTKPVGEGNGLGLDIVKKIIDKHQGEINFSSDDQQTTFSIYLPLLNNN